MTGSAETTQENSPRGGPGESFLPRRRKLRRDEYIRHSTSKPGHRPPMIKRRQSILSAKSRERCAEDTPPSPISILRLSCRPHDRRRDWVFLRSLDGRYHFGARLSLFWRTKLNESEELLQEGERLLRDVTKDPDGKPMAISRFGWKIIEIEGRKYLAAATPNELLAALANKTEPALVALREQLLRRDFRPFCSGIGPGQCQHTIAVAIAQNTISEAASFGLRSSASASSQFLFMTSLGP
jgi:hypothetical protein